MTLSPQRLEKATEALHRHHAWSTFWSHEDAKQLVATAISAYLGEDMVVVPREPTEAMVDAAYESFGCHEIFRVEEIQPGDLYRAMLSASLTERDAG